MIEFLRRILRPAIPQALRPKIYRTYARLRYFGLRKQCSMCGARLARFLPFGNPRINMKDMHLVGIGVREEALCPVCGSYDRERLVQLFLLNETTLFQRSHYLLHIAPEINIEAILKNQPTVNYLTGGLKSDHVMQEMDITSIPYPEGTFDAVICNHVLEHIQEEQQAMSEIYRVLKPGGWAILQVPLSLKLEKTLEDPSATSPVDRERIFGQWDHIRLYGRDYADRLNAIGFNVREFRWIDHPNSFGGRDNNYGLNLDEVVYFVKKH